MPSGGAMQPSVRRLAGTRADRCAGFGAIHPPIPAGTVCRSALQFSLAAVSRQKSTIRDFGPYEMLSRGSLPPAWQNCAKGEQWLYESRGMAPKPTLKCTSAARVPWLDGKLNDEVWQLPQSARLTSSQGDDDRGRPNCWWQQTSGSSIWPSAAGKRWAQSIPRRRARAPEMRTSRRGIAWSC